MDMDFIPRDEVAKQGGFGTPCTDVPKEANVASPDGATWGRQKVE